MSRPDDTRLAELRADIRRERDRRYWTIDQWREVAGDEEWPGAIANCRRVADDAVDALLAALRAAETRADEAERRLEEWRRSPGQTRAGAERDALAAEVAELREALDGAYIRLPLVEYAKLGVPEAIGHFFRVLARGGRNPS